jgi:hypothetical protein
VIFQSFQSGNLKQLDLELYLKLRLPTTKRMYRFLDKRFYRRIRLDFDLRTLACEHIGLSRSYAPTELKRRLKPALEELEQLGFLEVLSAEERYSYVKRGTWRIILIRGRRGPSEPDEEQSSEPNALVEALRGRGVTSKIAQELVAGHPATRVRTKIEVFDWLIRNEDKRVGKNPAGYLVASIRADYQEPGDYRASTEAEATAQGTRAAHAAAEAKAADEKATAEAGARAEKEREAKLRAAWEKLPTDQRDAILASVKADNPGLSRWKNMLEPLCLAVLEARLREQKGTSSQPLLFPDGDAAK